MQPAVVAALRAAGHEVYDFRNPGPGKHGFSWSEIDEDWPEWSPEQYVNGLSHERAEEGFDLDMDGLNWSDATVLVLPCGRSAHLEAGYAAGQGKPVIILLDPTFEPELMYKMAYRIAPDLDGVLGALTELAQAQKSIQWLYPDGVTVYECPNECGDSQAESGECPGCGENLLPFTALHVECQNCQSPIILNQDSYCDPHCDGAVPVPCDECDQESGHYVLDHEAAAHLERVVEYHETDGVCQECDGDDSDCDGCHGSGTAAEPIE